MGEGREAGEAKRRDELSSEGHPGHKAIRRHPKSNLLMCIANNKLQGRRQAVRERREADEERGEMNSAWRCSLATKELESILNEFLHVDKTKHVEYVVLERNE